MKKLLCLFTLLLFNLCFSQQEMVSVNRISTDDKVFTAVIDEKYSITIYLKFFAFSEDHLGIYSVQGWYYYDKIQTKIPLVGIYDSGLTLFHFKSKSKDSEILNFEAKDANNIWDKLDALKAITGFEEQFVFDMEDSKLTGKWISKDKTLPVRLAEDKLEIVQVYEFLQINDGKDTRSINLYDLNLYLTDLDVVSYAKNASQMSVLLEYDYPSKLNVQGMCGGGQEKGYVSLSFDKDYAFTGSEEIRTESCLEQISSETNPKNENEITIFKGINSKKNKILLDKKNAKIIRL